MSDTPDYYKIIAECLTFPDPPSSELISLVQTVLRSDVSASRTELQQLHQRIGTYPRRIALVYGGATKIKGYVFEAPRLPEIRGASALLDWIGEKQVNQIWHSLLPVPNVAHSAPHPYIIYAGGGSFLAFAPRHAAQELATRVEREYLKHTLTANSVVVAADFDLLELRYGRLFRGHATDQMYWVEDFLKDCQDPIKWVELATYYYPPEDIQPDDKSEAALQQRFLNRKTFGELVTVLATMFHRRRDERSQHGETRYLPHYELMPWDEKCQSSDIRPAVIKASIGNDSRLLSEASARKLAVGRLVKGVDVGDIEASLHPWMLPTDLRQQSWESRWQEFLQHNPHTPYAQQAESASARPATDLADIGAASDPQRYIGLIYADGNNIGRLMATLQTPTVYYQVSHALTSVAQHAVFTALAIHLKPHRGVHPFEILTIGGDDLFIVVPGHQAFDIAVTIARTFEQRLSTELRQIAQTHRLSVRDSTPIALRYNPEDPTAGQITYLPLVGLSAGVLIAQENTPFFFLRDLVEELLKKAKKLAKHHADEGFFGGAVDFMVLKSISMVSDNISSFRAETLQDTDTSPRRLTARPYTWDEFAAFLNTVRAIKQMNVPRSQLYRLRTVLTSRPHAGIFDSAMEYLYTRSRLRIAGQALHKYFEQVWCYPSLAAPHRMHVPPWSSRSANRQYETVWPDLLEAYDFVETI